MSLADCKMSPCGFFYVCISDQRQLPQCVYIPFINPSQCLSDFIRIIFVEVESFISIVVWYHLRNQLVHSYLLNLCLMRSVAFNTTFYASTIYSPTIYCFGMLSCVFRFYHQFFWQLWNMLFFITALTMSRSLSKFLTLLGHSPILIFSAVVFNESKNLALI